MRRFATRLSYANVSATLALCIALGPPTAAAAAQLITGDDVQDGSITGVDIRDHSVARRDVDSRALLPPSLSATHDPITDYQDRAVIVRRPIPRGIWLLLGRFTVTNTGANSDNFGCGFRVAGNLVQSAGASVDAGQRANVNAANVVRVGRTHRGVAVICDTNGTTTLDISKISLRLIKLG
ncbi:MAG: hypothetical protein QOJ13_1102 [Gaiellales bacterium]|jgi:hypothetical protein|nr:hypothetical protein [Gaiellales bacterium]